MPGFPGAPVLSPREPFSPLGPGRPAGPGTPIILGPRGRCRERGTELSRGEALMPSSLVGGMPEKKTGRRAHLGRRTNPTLLPPYIKASQIRAHKEIHNSKEMGYTTVKSSWPASARLLEELELSSLPSKVSLTWRSMGALGSWKSI